MYLYLYLGQPVQTWGAECFGHCSMTSEVWDAIPASFRSPTECPLDAGHNVFSVMWTLDNAYQQKDHHPRFHMFILHTSNTTMFCFFMDMWTMHVLQRSHAKSSNLFRASFACCFFRAFAIWLLFTNAILSLTAPAALVECYIHPDLQEALLKHTHPPPVSLQHASICTKYKMQIKKTQWNKKQQYI